jgi:hypothetical protein
MSTPRYIEHPHTKELHTIKNWAKEYQIPRTNLQEWFDKHSVARVFDCLDKGISPCKGNPPISQWKNGMKRIRTIADWATDYDLSIREFLGQINSGKIKLVRHKQIAARVLENPYTGETRTVSDWANGYFGMPPTTLRWRLQRYTAEQIFNGEVRSHKEKKIKNPATKELLYLDEWAIKLGISPKAFRMRLQNPSIVNSSMLFMEGDTSLDLPKVGIYELKDDDDNNDLNLDSLPTRIAERNNVLLCHNPFTKERKPAYEWAKIYDVPVREFWWGMRTYGRNSRALYLHFMRQPGQRKTA